MFGSLIGGSFVFFLSIIIETFGVNYALYFKPNLVKNIICGVYALKSFIIMVASIMELELNKYDVKIMMILEIWKLDYGLLVGLFV